MKNASFLILLTLLAASIEPILVKLGYQGSMTPLQILAYKNIIAAIAMILITRSWNWVGKDKFLLVLPVALLLLLTNTAVIFSLKYLSAITIITIITTTPAFVALVNMQRGLEKLNARFWGGLSLSLFGVLLTINAFTPELHQSKTISLSGPMNSTTPTEWWHLIGPFTNIN